jgi:hypothetical protein
LPPTSVWIGRIRRSDGNLSVSRRSTFAGGDVSNTIYIYQSLTLEQALDSLIDHYKAWSVNRPGGRN